MVNIICCLELLPPYFSIGTFQVLLKCFHDTASKVPMHKSHLPLSSFIALTNNADISTYKQSAVSNASI